MSLALLQEEELENAKKKQLQKPWKPNPEKSNFKKLDNKGLQKQAEGQDKLQSLKAFRRENELCFKCGEKWGHNHECPPQVPLHVLDEIWDAMEPISEISDEDEKLIQNEEVVLAVDTLLPPSSRRTMRLLGHIGKSQLLILVDSGSVGTFVSTKLVDCLKLPTQVCEAAQYKAADGGLLHCTQVVPQLEWYTQKHSFKSTAKVLNLQCYDMILGQDWLEEMSPMWVD